MKSRKVNISDLFQKLSEDSDPIIEADNFTPELRSNITSDRSMESLKIKCDNDNQKIADDRNCNNNDRKIASAATAGWIGYHSHVNGLDGGLD